MLIRTKFEGYWGDGIRLYLGGGGSAPAPDPRLIEAQIKSLGVQDDVIAKLLANTERFAPLQEEQLRAALDAQKQAQTESSADREYALGRRGVLTGVQNQIASDAEAFSTEQRRDELAGEAIADVSQSFSGAKMAQMRDLTRMGVNPNDGRRAAFDNQFSVSEALAKATAATKARQGARAEGYALTDRANNTLAGYPAQSMQATTSGAAFGTAGLTIANQGLAGQNQGFNGVSAAAGQQGSLASGAFGAQASYANGQRQAQAAEDGQTYAAVGTAASLGVALAI